MSVLAAGSKEQGEPHVVRRGRRRTASLDESVSIDAQQGFAETSVAAVAADLPELLEGPDGGQSQA
jgi:AcrR family transcriptional regulator